MTVAWQRGRRRPWPAPVIWPVVGVVRVDVPYQTDENQLLLNRIVIVVAGMLGGDAGDCGVLSDYQPADSAAGAGAEEHGGESVDGGFEYSFGDFYGG